MKDLDYVKENLSREQALRFHLSCNFYPPLPESIKQAFVDVFTDYWNDDLPLAELDDTLAKRAGYTGGVHQYDFWQFLNIDDDTGWE